MSHELEVTLYAIHITLSFLMLLLVFLMFTTFRTIQRNVAPLPHLECTMEPADGPVYETIQEDEEVISQSLRLRIRSTDAPAREDNVLLRLQIEALPLSSGVSLKTMKHESEDSDGGRGKAPPSAPYRPPSPEGGGPAIMLDQLHPSPFRRPASLHQEPDKARQGGGRSTAYVPYPTD